MRELYNIHCLKCLVNLGPLWSLLCISTGVCEATRATFYPLCYWGVGMGNATKDGDSSLGEKQGMLRLRRHGFLNSLASLWNLEQGS